MKKTLIATLALAILASMSTVALAGYPMKVSASPYNGQIAAAQPIDETTSDVVSDQWNVPVEHKADAAATGAKGAANTGQRPYYKSMNNDTDHWNVPKEFAK